MKRIYIFIAFLSICLSSVSANDGVSAIANVYGRNYVSLNGSWNYFADPQEQGYYDYRMKPTPWGYFLNAKPKKPSDLIEYDFDKSQTMNIPSDWNTQDDKLFFYEGTVWFKRDFEWHPKAGRRTLIYFGAVNYDAIVFVNGKEVGHHIGGFTPFNYDVTDLLKEGTNFVIVKVDNKRHQDDVPTRNFDWWNYGGITRDVMLVDVTDHYIADYYLQLDKNKSNTINLNVQLNQPLPDQTINLRIPELHINKSVKTDAKGYVSLQMKAKPTLWCPENPKLYDVTLSYLGESIKDKIGFRTISTQGKKILLNGKPIFLRGISIHEETAYTNRRCNSAADADTLLSWAKSLNCNFVRLAHYPHNEHAVREAEKMGILVWSEIPVYWTISWENKDTYNNAQTQLHDMIMRDKNRANVIIWSIANETPHSDARDRFLGHLAQYAKSQDSIRLISMAMEVTSAENYVNRLDDNMNKYVDVVSFNQYIGWYRDVNDAKKMKWEIPYDKPVIISEFGGGALAGKHGDVNERWTEEFQANLYKENIEMIEKIDGLSGTTPWILKDFRSPRRPLPTIQNYFNRKGLISDQGKRKKAFWILRDWYLKK